ncbi:carboxymuconolactone decarboxylase family protein [Caldalkalibacillus salinus]|uniref:carboxymuconolactone decarboxylase family protein n=1 Tax=Caldalkalibacillus salinus TaxID=2803787 RepID=UPI001923953A|nr:carboxymuconolactone decarboxylase family protein [Caldalkalibacillus salinus]
MQEEPMENEVQLWLQEYKEGLGHFEEKMPEIAKRYNDFTGACFEEGALDKKMKHLIGVGISIFSQDEYCIVYHTQEALHKGATDEEILEVVGVCAAFGGGATMSQGVTLVQECLAHLNRTQH